MAPTALEIISQDLDWREAELGSLKLLLARNDITDHQKIVLLRASWALLYAHYEGFAKTSLTIFFDYARNLVRDCGSLPQMTRLFALDQKLRLLRSLPNAEFLEKIENFSGLHHIEQPNFPEIDTKSNLWPNVLEELLDAADIQVTALDTHRTLIKTLVSRRNKIAHGNHEMIQEISYYRNFESAVYSLMYEIAFAIDERLRRAPYV